MSFLTLDRGKEIHALALLLGAFSWWTPDMEHQTYRASELPFGGFKDTFGFCNWYDFTDLEAAETFKDLVIERYDPDYVSLEDFCGAETVFINWY